MTCRAGRRDPIIVCPGCDGAEDGCCVCDHTGRIRASALGMPENGLTFVPDVILAGNGEGIRGELARASSEPAMRSSSPDMARAAAEARRGRLYLWLFLAIAAAAAVASVY